MGTPAHGEDQYVELRPGRAVLALVSREAAEFMHGGSWEAAANRSAILEFSVDDVDAERERLEGFVTDWLQEPRTWRGAIGRCFSATRTATPSTFSTQMPDPQAGTRRRRYKAFRAKQAVGLKGDRTTNPRRPLR
ncbi:hypothetical protein MZO42_19695 [Sphingomonas psychrotolerans]|uniref:Uncharacterized protein n=1 Tax=Sphingomonas psychrotolerans TaxID=1327635 RepID=A0ABU3N8U2_9SPHN|nr:hypothetical protein [Sphingomonas psychrotolerans]MDT8760930.1 hypothetical protein [Sphingomonas psychrotolerans]